MITLFSLFLGIVSVAKCIPSSLGGSGLATIPDLDGKIRERPGLAPLAEYDIGSLCGGNLGNPSSIFGSEGTPSKAAFDTKPQPFSIPPMAGPFGKPADPCAKENEMAKSNCQKPGNSKAASPCESSTKQTSSQTAPSSGTSRRNSFVPRECRNNGASLTPQQQRDALRKC
ncbi:uncharacterized protein MONOS_10577 [Monocercomonoides exilis]|uniref:uncharacterized protein n=1 Tax=Monocercomonoides exilis TaxID=2049356 RepID=UPI003559A7C9|nr:hypothetical protein MONOS_10577 [Monocercomonoides exilis]|eukprot:MONOS_10577.1-p1 / transcript=MONOS_10577.1 / gene=MONOS_10577 / organism=Monocercomonoides_exilis_PA203 / gene_product=unspecified product / transcript_product=unspecified product / location=Mono_scaffold00486:17077-17653(-) / protein_length=171 / sequence_SO=supercontig / SO=protein_coding / is_pseudo=false